MSNQVKGLMSIMEPVDLQDDTDVSKKAQRWALTADFLVAAANGVVEASAQIMKRLSPHFSRLEVAVICCAMAVGGCRSQNEEAPLWEGATFTHGDRDRAVARGLAFIFATAGDVDDFSEYGSDYLWCFYSIAAAASDARLRKNAFNYGRILARRWRQVSHGDLTLADAETVSDMAMAVEASEALGVVDPDLRLRLEGRLPEFSVQQMLGFDPAIEPPPTRDIVLTGAEACTAAGVDDAEPDACSEVRRTIPDPDIWYDALIATYFGERFGVQFGASFAELMAWREELLPYRDRAYLGEVAWYDQAYMVTHLVYTHNDYGQKRLDPAAMPEEYAFLLRAFDLVLADGDAETFAEFVDTLKAFGHTPRSDVAMARALEEILASQNADGSWGNLDEEDVYDRYHPTWTAIDALKEYHFRPSRRRATIRQN